MKKVVLVFPNTQLMTEFILTQKIPNTEGNTRDKTLKGLMTDGQIEIACRQYGAALKQISKI